MRSTTPSRDADRCRTEQHWSLLHQELLWAYESEMRDVANGPAAETPPTGCWLVVTGACRVVQEGKSVDAKAGQWIYPKAGPRKQYFDTGTRILSVGFLARWAHGVDLISTSACRLLPESKCETLTKQTEMLVSKVTSVTGGPSAWDHSRHWRDALDADQHFEINGLFQVWLATFIRIAEASEATVTRMLAQDMRVEAAVRFMEAHPAPLTVTWPEIEERTSLSRRRLDELFRRETGLSLNAFSDRIHLNHIKKELLDLRKQIKEIAYDAGFEHTSSFTRWFRQRS